ncbi:MAG: hypothetical protein ACKVTZ_16315 [Bacteroidia bacterium]
MDLYVLREILSPFLNERANVEIIYQMAKPFSTFFVESGNNTDFFAIERNSFFHFTQNDSLMFSYSFSTWICATFPLSLPNKTKRKRPITYHQFRLT